MFYSDALLARNGPLARVWLASNLERKLTKQNVLAEKLETKVMDIIGRDSAPPMALRMSGQLLLGVVRIYSRKTRYLLDDCSEALIKIRMAFRPGQVDLPANQMQAAARDAQPLAETVAELDLLAPLPDPEELLREPEIARGLNRDPTLLDVDVSQLLPESQTPRRKQRELLMEDDDLGLDLGLSPGLVDRSIEVGRRAETPAHADQPSILLPTDDDLGLDLGMGEDNTVGPVPFDDDGDMMMMMDDGPLPREVTPKAKSVPRDTATPLSSIPAPDVDQQSFHAQQDEEEEDATIRHQHRAKRRKVIRSDPETELKNSQLLSHQNDRSAITKPTSFLPRNPLLLQLMEMQKDGGLVSSVIGEDRLRGCAPELRGILSLELVRKAGEKKRKRLQTREEEALEQPTPRLELPQDEDDGFVPAPRGDFDNMGGDSNLNSDAAVVPLPMSDDIAVQFDDEMPAPAGATPPPFDATEAPLVHPSQSGPVALGTKNAVQLLRGHLAPNHPVDATEPPTPGSRVRSEALFTDLCPEETTTRQDATKMFFELLVLATKDAVKVEQSSEELGRPIRLRGKRGLWGEWAEMRTQPETV
ncbi:hypothetical protein K470DRAFT_258848 [Piedraia hortae CBS 480.64]|uniref:Rad21/Rec8-like protein N-terminal domain-containing protein n=1 Tax=Piedraia hortae CBS 480.64 TaxID=1314780 RepID=A0A6A7BWC4_9PEZI|nr:hypothetical protein K470DRAFT_258848 [Piedraia hortae CBS 480.64]